MNHMMERLQAANPVLSCEPPPPSVLEFAILPRFRRLAENALPAAEYGRPDYSTVRIAGPAVGGGVEVIFA